MNYAVTVLLGLVLAGCAVTENTLHIKEPISDEGILNESRAPIPTSVLSEYDELAERYNGSLGAEVRYCINDSEVIYEVSGSGGFTGVIVYYDNKGNLIGSYIWDDTIDPNDPEPPVKIQAYNCTTIKQS